MTRLYQKHLALRAKIQMGNVHLRRDKQFDSEHSENLLMAGKIPILLLRKVQHWRYLKCLGRFLRSFLVFPFSPAFHVLTGAWPHASLHPAMQYRDEGPKEKRGVSLAASDIALNPPPARNLSIGKNNEASKVCGACASPVSFPAVFIFPENECFAFLLISFRHSRSPCDLTAISDKWLGAGASCQRY